MSYVLKEKPASAPTQQREDDAEQAPRSRVQVAGANVQLKPTDEKGGAGKDAKKDGGGPGKEAVTKEEEERREAVQAKWEDLLGNWLGGELSKLVLEHVSLDALNGYVQEGLKSAGPSIGKAITGATKPDKAQEQALKDFNAALEGVIVGQVEKWANSPTGQKVLKSISNFVQGHPVATLSIVGTALIGGALAAWFTNQDVPTIEVPLKLGKGWQLKAGVDLGAIQNLGFQGASLVVANKAKQLTAKAEVKKEEKDDGTKTQSGNVAITKGPKGKETLSFVLNGKITETKDGKVAHSASGALKLMDPKSGVKVSVGADGKWSSNGSKEQKVNFKLGGGKAFSGSLDFGATQATVVDEDGNIHEVSSQELKVAVGEKGQTFSASVKHEEKDGEHTTTIGAAGEAQLGGALFKGTAGVSVGEAKTTVKLNGSMNAKIAGKDVEFSGAYDTEGAITGKIRVGEGNEYREIVGTKSGDTVTFSTVEVFNGVKHTKSSKKDGDGKVTNTESVAAPIAGGKGQVNASASDDGTYSAGGKMQLGKNTEIRGQGASDGSYGVGVTFTEDNLKAKLDFAMKEGMSTIGASAEYNKDGFQLSADLKYSEERIQELGIKLGYKDPAKFRTFLLGYKQTWSKENQQANHHFDALLEYSLGKWSGRLNGGLDVSGGELKKAKLDLGLGYDLGNNWKAIGGVQYDGQMGDNQQFGSTVKPYVGVQYGKIGVAGYFDTKNKGGGLMLTIPF